MNRSDAVKKILSDYKLFFRLLKIKDKKGDIIPFSPNAEQKELLKLYFETEDDILVLKPRQIGSSTLWAAIFFYKWYTSRKPISLFALAHTSEASKNFLNMWITFYENLPEMFKRPLSIQNATTLQLADSGAKLITKSAGGKGGIRSFTANEAILSEFAFWDKAEESLATIIPALNNGRMVLESTPNFFGDPLHVRFLQAQEDKSYKAVFFPWHKHEEYALTPPQDFKMSIEEQTLKDSLNLSTEQIYWRRKQIQKLGFHKFKRDYPTSLLEAYSQGDSAYLEEELLSYIKPVTLTTNHYSFEEPQPNTKYALGADTSLGVKKDYSVIYVINAKTKNVAYTWFSNEVGPAEFGAKILDIATRYNKALVLVEANNTGWVTLQELINSNYSNLWMDKGKHWLTTSKTKPELFDLLRDELQKKNIKYLDTRTIAQLRSLQVDEKNNIIMPQNENGHADSVMALALALRAVQNVNLQVANITPQLKLYQSTSFRR